MPYRKNGRKRVIRRKPRRKNTAIAKPMKPVTYRFKRVFEEIVDLYADQGGAEGWVDNDSGLYKQFTFTLAQLPGYTDFVNLFHSYRLTGVNTKMYFSQTVSGENSTPQSFSNSQLLMRIAPNHNGASANQLTSPLNQQFFNETAATKRRLCLNSLGKPLVTYTPLKQLSQVYHTASNTDYTIQSPKWISTGETGTTHYGLNCRIDRVDGEAFTTGFNNKQKVRIMHTVYLECRQVQ